MEGETNAVTCEATRFFAGYPQQLDSFKAIAQLIDRIGPATIEVKKSQISWGTKYKFAWVWLPLRFSAEPTKHARPIGSLVLTFALDRLVKHDRIVETANPQTNRWTHHIIISSPGDVDGPVEEWLREAYDFSKRSYPMSKSFYRFILFRREFS